MSGYRRITGDAGCGWIRCRWPHGSSRHGWWPSGPSRRSWCDRNGSIAGLVQRLSPERATKVIVGGDQDPRHAAHRRSSDQWLSSLIAIASSRRLPLPPPQRRPAACTVTPVQPGSRHADSLCGRPRDGRPLAKGGRASTLASAGRNPGRGDPRRGTQPAWRPRWGEPPCGDPTARQSASSRPRAEA